METVLVVDDERDIVDLMTETSTLWGTIQSKLCMQKKPRKVQRNPCRFGRYRFETPKDTEVITFTGYPGDEFSH